MTNHNAANERIKHHYAACLTNFLRHSGQSIDTAIKSSQPLQFLAGQEPLAAGFLQLVDPARWIGVVSELLGRTSGSGANSLLARGSRQHIQRGNLSLKQQKTGTVLTRSIQTWKQ